MKKYFVITAALCSAFSNADEFKLDKVPFGGFKPRIEYSNDDPVCNVVLHHYTRIFLSDAQQTFPIEESDKISYPVFEPVEVSDEGFYGSLEQAKINIEGIDKLLVYYSRNHSWRGDIYTGYLINDDELPALINSLNGVGESKFQHIYPAGSASYGSDFTWWNNRPFKLDNKWYVVADFRDFGRHDSMRDVYQFSASSEVKKTCTVKIFENFEPNKLGKNLPFFTAYKLSLEKIMLSSGHCGTSHPEIHAASKGKFYASMAVVRPWAIPIEWNEVGRHRDHSYYDFQKRHFEDWKYQDVWSYREKDTLDNLMNDAAGELKNYYMKSFQYPSDKANQLAVGVINNMPGQYYSLGVYHDDGVDFSPFQEMIEGRFSEWRILSQVMMRKRRGFPDTMLTLLVDFPEALKNLPNGFEPENIQAFYHKDFLMFAAHMNNYQMVKALVDSKYPLDNKTEVDNKGVCGSRMERTNRTALTYAAENSSIHIIKYLVKAGADVEVRDSKGNSLDYYLKNNPRFTEEEKTAGFKALLEKYKDNIDISPSFSCNGKLNTIEKAICNNEALSIYDRELAQAYQKASIHQGVAKILKASQIGWIKTRSETCSSYNSQSQIDACIARMSRARIRYLEYVDSSFGLNQGQN